MSTGYLQAKPMLRILILGSYDKTAEEELYRIKKFLIGKGYVQTRLVEDFKNPLKEDNEIQSDYNLRKTEHWLPEADVGIFVFFPLVNNDGVELEFKHVNDFYLDMIWRSIIGWSQNPRPKVSSLMNGLVNRWNEIANIVFFENIADLNQEIYGVLIGILEKLYFRVIFRGKGEWELDSQI
jgi:hypothetical protein